MKDFRQDIPKSKERPWRYGGLGWRFFRSRHGRAHSSPFHPGPGYEEFHRMHRSLRYLRPVLFFLNLVILYALFRWMGMGTLGKLLAGFIILKGILELLYLWRLEKRVFTPIDRLKNGFAEIAGGNYQVSIDGADTNEFGQLIESFNAMAQKLQESNQRNLEYEENRKNLIANISHDLKTPLTSIQGYIDLIRSGSVTDTDRIDKYLRTIASNTGYMNKLIDDLFLFSKLDLDRMEFNCTEVSARAFMGDIMEEFRFEIEEQQLQFIYEDRLNRDCRLNIDGKRVFQAIRNIIGNAVKYGPGNNLIINAVLTRQDEQICLAIRDNGPGIPPDKLPHIFDRFYRIDTERSLDLVSTGLGLAIARELVEGQGGRITGDSTPGAGTCFTICLPVSASGDEVQE